MKKYRALNIIAGAYRIIAIITIALGLLAGIVSMFSRYSNVGNGLLIIGASLLVGLACFAFAEMVNLFIDIQANTAAAAEYLRRMGAQRRDAAHPLTRRAAGD